MSGQSVSKSPMFIKYIVIPDPNLQPHYSVLWLISMEFESLILERSIVETYFSEKIY